ncbi:MAG: hypothetical protein ACI8QS_000971 [Planctomycetota bacterium]|jgi:hypothetical protein
MENKELEAAERLLQEAVYRSRGKQAGVASLAGADLDKEAGPGNCGLGHGAQVDLEQSEEGRAAFGHLFPGTPSEATMEGLSGLLATWVKRQDGLDRKRNHFLRDFRDQHGYDRRAYTEEQRATYGDGLDSVNAEENEGRHAAQLEVLELARAASA